MAALPGSGCIGIHRGVNKVQRMLNSVTSRMGLFDNSVGGDDEAVGTFRINAPGQRFTATHGIAMRKGMEKNMM